jgi:hypothetical protein
MTTEGEGVRLVRPDKGDLESGTGFLGSILVVAGKEDDVLAEAGSCLALINDGSGMSRSGGEEVAPAVEARAVGISAATFWMAVV